MTSSVIFFNHGAINLCRPLKLIRAARRPGEFRLLASHDRPHPPLQRLCDEFFLEPRGLSDPQYVDWCLEFAQRHGVRLLIPGRRASVLAAEQHRFDRVGTKVLSVGDPETLKMVSDKSALYAHLANSPLHLPPYAVVRNAHEFAEAITKLREAGFGVCYKPTHSVYGIGFRVVTESLSKAELRACPPQVKIPLAAAQRAFAGELNGQPHLVMRYLSGVERSLDCLAADGRMLRCVVRRKPQRQPGPQYIENHPALVNAARWLTQNLRLNGLFNIQFRDAGGRSYLLEINPRMSGGLRYACQAGICLPYWALRLGLDGADLNDLPTARTGFFVQTDAMARSF